MIGVNQCPPSARPPRGTVLWESCFLNANTVRGIGPLPGGPSLDSGDRPRLERRTARSAILPLLAQKNVAPARDDDSDPEPGPPVGKIPEAEVAYEDRHHHLAVA